MLWSVYPRVGELHLRPALTEWETVMIREWQGAIHLTSNHCSRRPARPLLSSNRQTVGDRGNRWWKFSQARKCTTLQLITPISTSLTLTQQLQLLAAKDTVSCTQDGCASKCISLFWVPVICLQDLPLVKYRPCHCYWLTKSNMLHSTYKTPAVFI